MQAQCIAGHRTAVIVENDGKPRSCGLTAFVEDPQIQRRVIGLPHLVRPTCLPPVQQLEAVRILLRPIVRQHHQAGIQAANDAVHGGIARLVPAVLLGYGAHPAMHRGHRGRRSSER
jgi:hypothetical protein